ncbi:hypothetical protein [Burkholderia cepacia]|uniref:hypothetical protein n=1 Tax=Burkholderia cepacia TaxID=292 RepID=UPI001CE39F50|nr:hypothetical protein [Burkholderia cepacia]
MTFSQGLKLGIVSQRAIPGDWDDRTEEYKMLSDNHIDLELALRKIHELGVADGDLGYAYWYEVGRLLQRAANMQAEIDLLCNELEQCRATRADANRAVKQRRRSTSKAR